MTPQASSNVDQKSGKFVNQVGMEIDDPSFLKKFGSNLTGNPPEDEDFDPNLSVIKETDQSNLIEPNEFNNYYFEGRDSLRNSIKGTQVSNPQKIGSGFGLGEKTQAKPEATTSGNSSQYSSSLKNPEKPLPEKVSLSDSLKNILNQNLQRCDEGSGNGYTTPKLTSFYDASEIKLESSTP